MRLVFSFVASALAAPRFRSAATITVGYMLLLRTSSSSAFAASSRATTAGSGILRSTGSSRSSNSFQLGYRRPVSFLVRGGGSATAAATDNGSRDYSTSTTSLSATASKMDQSFPTWSFDKPCASMEWTTLSNVTVSLAPDDAQSIEDGSPDLVLIGITVPRKPKASADATTSSDDNEDEEDDVDESDKAKAESEPAVSLTGRTALSIDQGLQGALSELLVETKKSFKYGAKIGSLTPALRPIGLAGTNAKAKRYAMLGLGKAPKPGAGWTAGMGRSLGKALAERLAADKAPIRTVHIALPMTVLSNATIVRDFATALYQELVSDNRYRTGDKIKTVAPDLQSIVLFTDSSDDDANVVFNKNDIADALTSGRQLAAGVLLTKDIVNAPHNVLNSESLADTAKRIAKEHASVLKCQVLGKKECEARGMGAYLGVARGSETEPQFIHITYTPPKAKSASGTNAANKVIGVVGKGLLFDTGGYNIKTAMMEQMKFDCGGAAAVLGAARAIGQLQPPNVEVHFVVAACENMINQKAMVPSDILTASNGKTIEVLNTDAEGRLTLADALVFADKEVGCESIIELSTLTGACMIALGKAVSGVWTDNDVLAAELADISKTTGDMSWRMPLVQEYVEDLESKIADIKNIGGKYGGSITAALFLKNFVSKKKPFAHIDIAGPVWSDKTGATGYGTKLIVEWVTRQGAKANE